MGAESSPMATEGSGMVRPILAHSPSGWQFPKSSASSATMAPGRGTYHAAPPLSRDWKPTRLPKDIFITASAIPFSTA